ncbi:MAG: aldo/keto reductase [Melioribacteraceae bacterium]|nr:aldo/keto reductase [Melioribacteraceae bacterium]MCF8355473.1 aldo/keto reductase [Melioribacteraceae bacterium]MCF8392550.1 aldo/keto reductase [Melioribacteraceae bacterium]MCF8418435.1 aldo/keto reductase [Melioribacteraceae bacterium]
MKYRMFGNMKWEVSEIGFGGWAIGGGWGPQSDEDSVKALHRAIDLGVNFIDTAQGYGDGKSEEIIGEVLKERSEDIFVATKVPPKEFDYPPRIDFDANKAFPKNYLIEECEKSLKRLKRDYIDVYQLHTWSAKFNINDELFETFEKLKNDGKIRASGASVPDTAPHYIIGALVDGKIDSIQLIYNLFEQFPAWNTLKVCKDYDIGVIVRVPFDEGALTGKYDENTIFSEGDIRNHYFRGNNLKIVSEKVNEIVKFKAEKFPELSMADFALKFCLSNNTVSTVIPGIRNIHQAEMNTSVSDGKYFTSDELKELSKFAWRKDFWNEEVS